MSRYPFECRRDRRVLRICFFTTAYYNRQVQKVEVVLYSKPGCHLCEEMKQEIARAGCAELYSLREINIETNPDLLAKYKYDIPILVIDGIEAFRHRLKAEDFNARMRAAQKRRSQVK